MMSWQICLPGGGKKGAMSQLIIRQLNPHFGAEISGLNPSVPLDAATVAELRSLFDSRGLIVIRDIVADLTFQNYLSQLLIGNDWPEPSDRQQGGETSSPSLRREMFVSNKRENGGAPFGRLLFHSDRMWSPHVFQLLSLYGIEVAQPAIPTLFVSAQAAWENLPDELRAEIDGLSAIHGHDKTYDNRSSDEKEGEVLISTFEKDVTVKLPIGFTHPRTGKTLLYISEMFTQRIDAMARDESEAMLRRLFDHMYAEGNVVTHTWRKGDLVLWDNIALQHARPNVRLDGPPRTLRKVFAPPPDSTLTQRPRFQNSAASAAG